MPNRVLLVEDDDVQRELSTILLSREGLTVTAVSDGAEAERLIFRRDFDLILLDVNIPFKDGFEICSAVKGNRETRLIPVVMLTGYGDTANRLRGFDLGADDFLTKPIDPVELKVRIRSLLKRKSYTDELERAEQVLIALGKSIEAKDPMTQGHCERISRLSVEFGRELNLNAQQLGALDLAGAVHDIGKVAVSDAILLKSGPLLPEEWDQMREHPSVGERICQPLRSLHMVTPIIRHHHEKQDGSGYPDGLRGSEVPLLARVMQIVDVYDALTSERPYRSALSASSAVRVIKGEVERGWWDPAIFRTFQRLAENELFFSELTKTDETQPLLSLPESLVN